jgi:hypothetical protein
MPPSESKEILKQLTSLATTFATHLVGEKETVKKVDAMYKVLVTGNGEVPLPETVRKHTAWIEEHNYDQATSVQEKKDAIKTAKAQANTGDSATLAFKRQLWILAGGEIVVVILFILNYFKK